MFLAHPKADICSLVAQNNKGKTSLSHLSLQTFLFSLGKLGLVQREQTLLLYNKYNDAVCRWTSVLVYTRDVLLSVDCVTGPWETLPSQRAPINCSYADAGHWCQNISNFNKEGYFWVLGSSSRENTSSCCHQRLLHQLQESQEGFRSWAPPDEATESFLPATGLSQCAASPQCQAEIFLETAFPV